MENINIIIICIIILLIIYYFGGYMENFYNPTYCYPCSRQNSSDPSYCASCENCYWQGGQCKPRGLWSVNTVIPVSRYTYNPYQRNYVSPSYQTSYVTTYWWQRPIKQWFW